MNAPDLLRDKILNAAERHMLKFGYRKVTMDEIAQDLAMSKNTIYKQFASKEEIAKSLVKRLQQQLDGDLQYIEETFKDPLEVFFHSIRLLRKQLGPWFAHFLREIPAELPNLWEEFLRYRNEKISGIRLLVEKGMRRKTFRKVNSAIAVEAYLGAVKAVVNPRFLEQEKLSFDAALEAVLDMWAHGLLRQGGE